MAPRIIRHILMVNVPIVAVALLCAGMPLTPALAQSESLQPMLDRLARLERDIRTLNVQIARGGGATTGSQTAASAGASLAPGTPAAARLAVRLDGLERDLRGVTGRIEELNHQILQVNRRLDKISNDLAFRQPGGQPAGQTAAHDAMKPMTTPVPGVSPAEAAREAARAAGVTAQAAAPVAAPAEVSDGLPNLDQPAAAAPTGTPAPAGGSLGRISQAEIDAIRAKRNAKRAKAGKPVTTAGGGADVTQLPTEITEAAPAGGDVAGLPAEVGGGETGFLAELSDAPVTAAPAPAPAPVAPRAAPAAASPTAAPLEPTAPGAQQVAVGPVLPEGSPREQYLFAFNMLRQAKYVQAERTLMAFLEQHPQDRLAANARYWLGETYYVRGDFVSAAEVFLEGYQSAPDGPKAADALLKLGMSLASIDKKVEACAAFDKVRKDFPTAPAGLKSTLNRQIQKNGCL